MSVTQIAVPRIWRSQLDRVALLLVLIGAGIWLSHRYPGSVISGVLFSVGQSRVVLRLPLFWLLPFALYVHSIVRLYNVRYVISGRGIEARTGILGLQQTTTVLRFEDIRSVEIRQGVLDRFLDVGTLEMGTSATSLVEAVFSGIAHPREVQNLITAERDRRQELVKQQSQATAEERPERVAQEA